MKGITAESPAVDLYRLNTLREQTCSLLLQNHWPAICAEIQSTLICITHFLHALHTGVTCDYGISYNDLVCNIYCLAILPPYFCHLLV